MKKFKFLTLTLLLWLIPSIVKANSISNIDMDIYIDSVGDATVTETWIANITEGTEGWHPYFNVGNSSFALISATIDQKTYNILNNWNVSASFDDKAYQAGMYYPDSNEVDICFGISKYGTHTYTFKYKITNFVSRLTDADMVYWTLIPYNFSAKPNQVYIKIYSDFSYEDTLDVWGYGNYGGTAYVYDGYIEMSSNGTLDSSEYMTILIKFPLNTFETNNILNSNFNYYYNMAEEGSTDYVPSDTSSSGIFEIIISILPTLMPFIIVINVVLIPFIIVIIVVLASPKRTNYRYGKTGNKVKKDIPNFREIPCNKDIYRANFVAERYNLNKNKEDFLGTILLKWLKNSNVKVEKVESKKLFKKEINDNIIFISKPDNIIKEESELYDWMFEASKNGKLEANEFKKWCSNHYNKLFSWFDDIDKFERDQLILEGKITKVSQKKIFTTIYYDVNPSLMLEAEQMKGLKNFLLEFSKIKEREPIEVHLWGEYLMYAQIFGIAEEVSKQFEKLYPEISTEMTSLGYDYNDVIFLSNISHSGVESARTARSTAEARANSYSSGGGGFSSGGGGGGSFGGGGGGGGFR